MTLNPSRHLSYTFWAAVLLVVAANAQAQEERKELIAVMELQPVGASEVEASALSDRLREELLRTGQFTMVDRSQMEAVLEEQAFQQIGCTEQECAVQVGQILGVRKIVAGKLTKLSERLWQISCIIVDVETAETVRAESIQHQGDLFSLLTTRVPELAVKLTGAPRPRVAAPLPPVEEKPPPAITGEKPGWPLWTGWILLGSAAFFELAALSDNDDAEAKANESRTQNSPALFSEAQGLREDAEDSERSALLLGATGAGLLVYYYFFLEPEPAGTAAVPDRRWVRPPPLQVRVGPHAVRAAWTWRW